MPSPPLSHFPDLCLLAIFKHIPLSDLIRHIGLVCPKWARVQRDELKRRRSLVILQEDTQIEQIQSNPFGSDFISHVLRDDRSPWAVLPHQNNNFNALRVPLDCIGIHRLTEPLTTSLIALLPNITHLAIFQNNVSVLVSFQIVRLINQYATKLVSLQVEFGPVWLCCRSALINEKAQANMLALFDSINRLESLRHLTLNGNFKDLNTQPSLRILSRLTTFTVHSFEPPSLLIASLRQYATTGDVRVDCHKDFYLSKMIQFDPQLATRFTRACLSGVSDYDNTRLFCTRFHSLTTLKLFNSMPMTMLARCLSLLPQLISLHLNFSQIPNEELVPQLPLAQVSSVRLLTLDIKTESHHDTERLHLHAIFPNLQVLHLIHYTRKCVECEYQLLFHPRLGQIFVDPQLTPRIGHCMSLARQPFRNCASLHTIRLETNDALQRIVLLPQELITVDQL